MIRPVIRRSACLWLCLAVAAQAAQPYRLFFSPEERARLEAARAATKSAPLRVPPADEVAKPRAAARTNSGGAARARPREILTGYVERSSGRNTLWINQRARSVEGGYAELDPLAVGTAPRRWRGGQADAAK